MKRVTFKVYEIEHNGDLDAAVAGIKKAGGKEVKVLESSFGSYGDATISALLPDDRKAFVAVLEEEGVCL